MKHVALIMILFVALTSCSLFKTKIKLEDAIAEKVKVESTSNPAKKYLILNNLKKTFQTLQYLKVVYVVYHDAEDSGNHHEDIQESVMQLELCNQQSQTHVLLYTDQKDLP